MNVKELMEELKQYEPEAEVKRAYGQMRISIPDKKPVQGYVTEPLLGVTKKYPQGDCLLIFEELS